MYAHLKQCSAKASNSTPRCFKLPSTFLFAFALGRGSRLRFGPLFYCLHKNFLWLSYGKGSGCNHQSPWGQRQTLMALPKLGQSSLPISSHWKIVKRLENYWKSPALHNIAFLSFCSQPHLVCSLPAELPLRDQGFLIGFPSYHTYLAAGTLAWVFCPMMGYFTVLSGTFLLQWAWILP